MDAASYIVSGIENKTLRLPFHAPLELLVGHGLEILLKSFLRSIGYNDKKLKGLGHDLEKLLSKSIENGLAVSLSEKETGHLKLLNNGFGQPPYTIRYLQTGFKTKHDDRVIIGMTRRIEEQIRPEIEAKHYSDNRQ